MSLATSSSSSLSFVQPPPPPPLVPRPAASSRAVGLRCYNSRSSSSSITTLSNILNSGVIACLRAQSPDVALEAARAAITGGISVLEIVVSTPGVFQVLHQLVQDFPTTTLGVGTVLNTKDAENAKNAGAKFIMSPAFVKGILDQDSDDLLYIPGVMTPTEILSSYNAGAKIVKIYPVSAIGGVGYIETLKKPFPHIPMVASQGITTDSVGAYIDAGASAVVLSDAIFDKKAMSQRNYGSISHLAQLAAWQGYEAVKRGGRYAEADAKLIMIQALTIVAFFHLQPRTYIFTWKQYVGKVDWLKLAETIYSKSSLPLSHSNLNTVCCRVG